MTEDRSQADRMRSERDVSARRRHGQAFAERHSASFFEGKFPCPVPGCKRFRARSLHAVCGGCWLSLSAPVRVFLTGSSARPGDPDDLWSADVVHQVIAAIMDLAAEKRGPKAEK